MKADDREERASRSDAQAAERAAKEAAAERAEKARREAARKAEARAAAEREAAEEAAQKRAEAKKAAELAAANMTVEEICTSIGADSLGYVEVEDIVAASEQPADRLCAACFDGVYPIPLPTDGRTGKKWLELERAARETDPTDVGTQQVRDFAQNPGRP